MSQADELLRELVECHDAPIAERKTLEHSGRIVRGWDAARAYLNEKPQTAYMKYADFDMREPTPHAAAAMGDKHGPAPHEPESPELREQQRRAERLIREIQQQECDAFKRPHAAAEPEKPMPDDVWRKWHKTVRDWVGYGPSPYEAFCAGYNAAYASPSAQPIARDEMSDAQRQLARFYNVDTKDDLISMQAHHIEKLQSKLPPLRDTQPRNPREG